MSTGTVISGAGHAGLILFLILGWGIGTDPLDFEVTEVSVITGEDFAALTSRPEPVESPEEPAAPATPAAPEVDGAPPPPPVEEAPPRSDPPTAPEPAAEPPVEAPPVVEETESLPPPPAPATEPVPQLVVPEPPAGAPEMAASPRPQPRPAPRVAPQAAPPPPPEAEIADSVQEAAIPDAAGPEATEEEEQEATAPEAAAEEIVTEAEEPAGGAPGTSPRPPVRPSRPAPPPTQTAEESSPQVPATDTGAVEDALAEALSGSTPEPSVPEGPPLTGSEREGFRVAVQECWNVDVGSTSASVTVTVSFDLSREGRVEGDVRLVGAEGADGAAQQAAFQAARRAILRCQSDGYALPVEKYDQWREVEMTFDPSGMRLR